MWKKTFIRSTLILLVVLAGIFVFATTHTTKKPASENCIKTNNQNDFLIWESLSRAIAVNAQF
jgi:hypothetical protein